MERKELRKGTGVKDQRGAEICSSISQDLAPMADGRLSGGSEEKIKDLLKVSKRDLLKRVSKQRRPRGKECRQADPREAVRWTARQKRMMGGAGEPVLTPQSGSRAESGLDLTVSHESNPKK